MYRTRASLVAVTLIFVCGDSLLGQGATARLYGAWEFDAQTTINALSNAKAKELADAFSQIEMTITFGKQGEFETLKRTGGRETQQEGAWKLVRELKGKNSGRKLEIEMSIGGQDPEQITVDFVKENVVKLVKVNNEVSFFLNRKVTKKNLGKEKVEKNR